MKKHLDIILAIIAVIILCGCMIGIINIALDTVQYHHDKESETLTWTIGTTVIDRRFTRPDNYELLYRTTYENGLSVDRWIAVTREEYFLEGRTRE